MGLIMNGTIPRAPPFSLWGRSWPFRRPISRTTAGHAVALLWATWCAMGALGTQYNGSTLGAERLSNHWMPSQIRQLISLHMNLSFPHEILEQTAIPRVFSLWSILALGVYIQESCCLWITTVLWRSIRVVLVVVYPWPTTSSKWYRTSHTQAGPLQQGLVGAAKFIFKRAIDVDSTGGFNKCVSSIFQFQTH